MRLRFEHNIGVILLGGDFNARTKTDIDYVSLEKHVAEGLWDDVLDELSITWRSSQFKNIE